MVRSFRFASRVCAATVLLACSTLRAAQPDSGGTRLKAGSDHLERGETAAAIRELKAAVAADPRLAAAHMLLGRAYLEQRSVALVAEAKAELQQALDLDPTLIWARFYLAKIYVDLGRYDKAREELQRGLQTRADVPHFLSLLGEVNRKLGKPELAIELNRKALAIDASMTPAHYHIALALLDLGKNDDAARELESAVQSRYVSTEMYLALASLYTGARRFDDAEELCRKAQSLDPSRPEPYLSLAQLYNRRGAPERALVALGRVLESGRSFPTTAYYQKLQADIFLELGRAHLAKGAAREAAKDLEHSLAFEPERGETHREMAAALFLKGDHADARKHAERAEQLGSPVDAALREQIFRNR
jgi:tetratricopeptide (TPR) repeat protein